ncbi:MAG: POTRA domain-containing protein [Bacteroidales bacterium]
MGSTKTYSIFSLFLLFLCFCFTAFAQEEVVSYTSPREYQIADITISGVEFLDNAALIHLSGLVVGQRILIPGDKISDAIDKLWKQNMFENIAITITRTEGNRVYLNIALEERPRLSKITFEGLSKGEINKIEEDLGVKAGDLITDYKISTIEKKTKKILLDKSYLNAEINVIRKADTSEANSLQLIVQVNKKSKVKISTITIEGNSAPKVDNPTATFWEKFLRPFNKISNPENLAFTDARIRRKLKNTKQVNFWRFWKKSKYVPSAFKEDLKTLMTAFNKEGYRDARVISDSIYKIDDKRIGIKINLFEGKPYYFGNIDFVGNKKYTELQLQEVLGIKKGELYNEEKFTKNLMSNPSGVDIYALYYDDGYLMFTATPVETNIHNDTVDMEIRIYEGLQSRFNTILLKGNTRTNDHVILRETRTVPGQLFSRSDLINSVNELRQLRFFNDQTINPDVQPNEDGSVNIQYQVEEVGSDQLELSGGWGGGMIVGTVHCKIFSKRIVGNPFLREMDKN